MLIFEDSAVVSFGSLPRMLSVHWLISEFCLCENV